MRSFVTDGSTSSKSSITSIGRLANSRQQEPVKRSSFVSRRISRTIHRCSAVICSTLLAPALSSRERISSRPLRLFLLAHVFEAIRQSVVHCLQVSVSPRPARCATSCLLYTSDAADEEDSVD